MVFEKKKKKKKNKQKRPLQGTYLEPDKLINTNNTGAIKPVSPQQAFYESNVMATNDTSIYIKGYKAWC